MAQEIERAGLGALGNWLTSEVPRAILDGGAIPSSPSRTATVRQSSPSWRSGWRRR